MLKKVLNAWGEYLVSPDSASVLSTEKTGWFGEHGLKALTDVANNGKTDYTFEQMFVCDPKDKYHGYKSWDDFFTRLFRFEDGIRPVASPDDDNVVVNCCESRTYKVAHGVKGRDKFWIKGQPYSVIDMLNHDPLAEHFVGGTIYQVGLRLLRNSILLSAVSVYTGLPQRSVLPPMALPSQRNRQKGRARRRNLLLRAPL